jgi:hypothetical protein
MTMRARASITLTGVVMVLASVTGAASAHPEGPRITQPPGQSGFDQGQTFTVRGTDCPAGASVALDISREPVGETTAAADGSFETQVTMPVYGEPDPDVEEWGERFLGAVCGGDRGGIVIVAGEIAERSDEELAYTGADPWATAGGAAALLAGALLLAATSPSRRGSRAGARV